MYRIACLFIVLIVSNSSLSAQHKRWRPGTDSLQVITTEDKIYRNMMGNISAYMIYQYVDAHREQHDLRASYISTILELLPPCNNYDEEYDIQLRPSNLTLPKDLVAHNYTIVEYTWHEMRTRLWYRGHGLGTAIGGRMPDYYSPLLEKGLIAMSSKDSNNIRYVSGYMFLDNICPYYFPDSCFDGNCVSESVVRGYVELRCYNYEPVIEHVDVEKKECLFYSNVMRKRYILRVLKDDNSSGTIYDTITELPEEEQKEGK